MSCMLLTCVYFRNVSLDSSQLNATSLFCKQSSVLLRYGFVKYKTLTTSALRNFLVVVAGSSGATILFFDKSSLLDAQSMHVLSEEMRISLTTLLL